MEACDKFDALDVLASQVSDQLNRNQEQLLRVLKTQKDQCSFYEYWWGEPIETVIAKVEQLSDESINEAFNTISQRVDEAKVAQAKTVLKHSTYALGITAFFSTLQVISVYFELRQASDLIESSRKKLASDGDIAKFLTETEQYLVEATKFLDQNELDLASDSLCAAGEKAQYLYSALHGIQDNCRNKIKTLKTNEYIVVGSGISTLGYGILQLATIVTTQTSGISIGWKLASWAVVGWNFLLTAFATDSFVISGRCITELQKILDEIGGKLEQWSNLNKRIDKMRELIKSKRLGARNITTD